MREDADVIRQPELPWISPRAGHRELVALVEMQAHGRIVSPRPAGMG
jgi:hypothetical protein